MASEKSARYLTSLDEALCKGDWASIPELARKVDKHSPQRQALTTAARIEAQISPSSFKASAEDAAIPTKLNEVIQANSASSPEDVYIASTCLAHFYWLLQDASKVIESLQETDSKPPKPDGRPAPVGWLEVCAVKRSLIRTWALETIGRTSDAQSSYQHAVSQQLTTRSPQHRLWTEQLLTNACSASQKIELEGTSLAELGQVHASYKAWGNFWNHVFVYDGSVARDPKSVISRRQTWEAYYDFLTFILHRGLTYNTSANSASDFFLESDSTADPTSLSAGRKAQRAEFKRVEESYITISLELARFPKASETNEAIERHIEKLVANWTIFNSPKWTDAEFGEGAKDGMSRELLAVLYRAASKTFHSTAILRYLFNTHAALHEFDLAMHAFDSYSEIVSKGKAREAKTGVDEPGIEEDEVALQTAVDAIHLLIRYGDRNQAEKAEQISAKVISWLEEQHPFSPKNAQSSSDDNPEQAHPQYQPTSARIPPIVLGKVYAAIGSSKAQWALYTYESEKRSSLLSESLNYLQHAYDLDNTNVEILYVLAMVLIEHRDITTAMQIAKRAISLIASNTNGLTSERQLVPLWHLIALSASSEDSFTLAANICENIFERLEDIATNPNVKESLDNADRENILQVKMTQVVLSELMDGSDEAVENISELLDTYTLLFGHPDDLIASFSPKTTAPATTTQSPSKQQHGTIKSIAGSIKPKSIRSVRSRADDDLSRPDTAMSVATTAHTTTNGELPPISITVTNEEGISTEKASSHHHHLHLPFRHHGSNGTHMPTLSEKPVGNDTSRNGSLEASRANSAQHVQSQSLAERRYGVAVLIRLWLFTAGVYARADSIEDALSAVQESGKLVELLEIDLAKSEGGSSARKLFARGWGANKSIDELWADVWSSRAQLNIMRNQPYTALDDYDRALAYFPDHPSAIIGVSNILMDIYEEKLPAEAPKVDLPVLPFDSTTLITEPKPTLTRPNSAITVKSRRPSITAKEPHAANTDPLPAELDRLAARDRAYMLLLNLTKLGTGRDNPEAWLTLARAHELSRKITKAKEALWWVVQLEESRPIRPWKECICGGYTL